MELQNLSNKVNSFRSYARADTSGGPLFYGLAGIWNLVVSVFFEIGRHHTLHNMMRRGTTQHEMARPHYFIGWKLYSHKNWSSWSLQHQWGMNYKNKTTATHINQCEEISVGLPISHSHLKIMEIQNDEFSWKFRREPHHILQQTGCR